MTCRICNNEKDNKSYVVREMFFGTKEEVGYFQCSSCGCLQIGVVPEDMGRYYPDGYYSFGSIDETSPVRRLKNLLRASRNRYKLFGQGLLGKMLERTRPGDMTLGLIAGTGNIKEMSILDVGCGSGMLLYQLREVGLRDLLGIDPFIAGDILYRNGLKVLKKSLHGLRKEAGRKFDLVMFNHSFEHMPGPAAVLEDAASVLSESGILMIRIPTVSSFAWEHYRTDWVQLDAPRHLFLHSVGSMELLAKKAGFELTGMVYDSTGFQFWGSEQYKRDIPLESPRSFKNGLSSSIFSSAEIEEFSRRAVELNRENRGDMAAFYLKKKAPTRHSTA